MKNSKLIFIEYLYAKYQQVEKLRMGNKLFNWKVRTLMKTANASGHGLRTPNEGIIQRYLKNWADVADKICFGRT